MVKKISELEKGDKLEANNGDIVRVTSVSNGFFRNSKIVQLSNNDWFCEDNKSTIEVQ